MTMAPPPFPDRSLGDTGVSGAIGRVEDAGMQVIALNPPVPAGTMMRCECGSCGAHVMVRRSWQIAGWCQNCRSHDIRALAMPTPPARPPVLVDLPPPVSVALPERRVA